MSDVSGVERQMAEQHHVLTLGHYHPKWPRLRRGLQVTTA